MPFNFDQLKHQQREQRAEFNQNIGLRVHRALSWLQKAEKSDDYDSQFIFFWISFNAAYANEINANQRFSEQDSFTNFIKLLVQHDETKYLESLVWENFSSSIRVLLNNQYIFKDFWEFQRGALSEQQWKTSFAKANQKANTAVGQQNTAGVLIVIFSRLYTLRNQTLHGGATYQSEVNREQMRDSNQFLKYFIPNMIKIMMDKHQKFIGEPHFPVVG